MKKIFAFAMLAVGFAACNNQAENKAAEDTLAVVKDSLPQATVITYTDGDIARRDGKVVVFKNGDWVAVDKDVTLDDGTVVTVTGEAKSKDGKVYVIEEGNYVNKTGKFFDKTGAAIENAWDATKEGVKSAADATKEGVEKAGDAIKEGAQKAGDKAKHLVEDIKH